MERPRSCPIDARQVVQLRIPQLVLGWDMPSAAVAFCGRAVHSPAPKHVSMQGVSIRRMPDYLGHAGNHNVLRHRPGCRPGR